MFSRNPKSLPLQKKFADVTLIYNSLHTKNHYTKQGNAAEILNNYIDLFSINIKFFYESYWNASSI